MPLNPTPQDKRGIVLPKSTGDFDAKSCPDGCPVSGIEIVDLSIVSKTATSVTLGWSGVDEILALERANSPGSFTEVKSGITTGSTQVTDSGLSDSTEYYYRLVFENGDSNTVTVTTNSSVSGDWVVYNGTENDWRSPIPNMVAVYPRPDSETSSIEYHRNYHGDLEYDILIDVIFGRWPYRYEIIQGPSGATIGNEMIRTVDSATGKILHEPGPNYGRVKWTPNGEVVTHEWIVRVTDQRGSTIDVSWTSDRNDSAFVELDSVNGSDLASGAVGDPLKTFAAGLWKNDDENTLFAGKIAVFTGTFDINAGTLNTSPSLDADKKPVAYVSRGNTTFNQNEGHWRVNTGGNLDGILFKGINFSGSRSDLGNNKVINCSGFMKRFSLHESSFSGVTVGSSGTDNPACLFFAQSQSLGQYHNHTSIIRNSTSVDCESQLVVTFDTHYASVQLNEALNANILSSNGDFFIQIKDDTSYACVRSNIAIGTGTRSLINFNNQNTKETITDQECCYNRLVFTGDQGVDQAVGWNTQGDADSFNTHDYANTAIGTNCNAYTFSSPETGDNVVWSGCLHVGGISLSGYINGAKQSVQLSESDFSSDGKLTGPARETYLGSVGSEIAGEAV